MKICENCIKEHDGSYGSGRFCSNKCARAFSTKNEKVKTKIAQCIECNANVEINKRASLKHALCFECRKTFGRKCKLCGRSLEFCKTTSERWICKKHTLYPTLIKYFGFDESVIGTEDVFEEFERVRNIIIEDYVDNHLSIWELMDKYEYESRNPRNFSKIMASLEIDRRTLSECVQYNIKSGKVTPYGKAGGFGNQQWHTTWNDKQVFLRSSLELDYAKQLDEALVNYECEKLRILYWDSQRKCQRIAIPDFYIQEQNTIVEIKCEYTLDEQNMKDKMKAYLEHGYLFKLIVDKEDRKL